MLGIVPLAQFLPDEKIQVATLASWEVGMSIMGQIYAEMDCVV
jgi:hypothetical protein